MQYFYERLAVGEVWLWLRIMMKLKLTQMVNLNVIYLFSDELCVIVSDPNTLTVIILCVVYP